MVTPDPQNWRRIPGYRTPNGFHAYMFTPDCSVWYWNTDLRRMCLCRGEEATVAREKLAAFDARMGGQYSCSG